MEENIETKVHPVETLVVELPIADLCSEYSSRKQWFHRNYDERKKTEGNSTNYTGRK